MNLSAFDKLGPLATAGLEATRRAIACASNSAAFGRIPIAGAVAVAPEDCRPNCRPDIIAVEPNGRIPVSGGPGYPTDHGETATIRAIGNVREVDWSRAVFVTTLSPCIMCTHAIMALYPLGLRRVVIAESLMFSGWQKLLRKKKGMKVLELTSPVIFEAMSNFQRIYPWDWQADIGNIPPGQASCPHDLAELLKQVRQQGCQAAVVSSDGCIVAVAADERAKYGGNPVYSSVMLAMGRAGSAINLREHTLLYAGDGLIDIPDFGEASLGACELFRPFALATDGRLSDQLRARLAHVGVEVRIVARAAEPSAGVRDEPEST